MIGVEKLKERRPLPLASAQRVDVLIHRGLLSGRTETALVQALSQQRERYCQSGGQGALSLSLDELVTRLGLAHQTHKERQRAIENLQKVSWRVNAKLYLVEWAIVSLHTGLGEPYLALFHFSEIGTS